MNKIEVGQAIRHLKREQVIEVKVVDMNFSRYQPLPVRVEGKIKCD